MHQSGLSAIAITDGTDSNELIGNFSVSDLRSAVLNFDALLKKQQYKSSLDTDCYRICQY